MLNIVGDRVCCRGIEYQDLGLLIKWHNDPEIARMIVGASLPLSMAEQQKWFEATISDTRTKRFMVDALDTQQTIGMTGFWEIDWRNRSALTALMIGEDCRGRGYGTDAIMAVAKYAFLEMNMNRLWSEILTFNEPSYRAYVTKCGWTVEGIKRQHVYRDGEFRDAYLVSILKDEYLSMALGVLAQQSDPVLARTNVDRKGNTRLDGKML